MRQLPSLAKEILGNTYRPVQVHCMSPGCPVTYTCTTTSLALTHGTLHHGNDSHTCPMEPLNLSPRTAHTNTCTYTQFGHSISEGCCVTKARRHGIRATTKADQESCISNSHYEKSDQFLPHVATNALTVSCHGNKHLNLFGYRTLGKCLPLNIWFTAAARVTTSGAADYMNCCRSGCLWYGTRATSKADQES